MIALIVLITIILFLAGLVTYVVGLVVGHDSVGLAFLALLMFLAAWYCAFSSDTAPLSLLALPLAVICGIAAVRQAHLPG